MDEILNDILKKLDALNTAVLTLSGRVDTLALRATEAASAAEKFVGDLEEFSERFEEVVTALEDERRLDLLREYD